MKVLINNSIGGWCLSQKALEEILRLKGHTIKEIEAVGDSCLITTDKDCYSTYSFKEDKYRYDPDVLKVFYDLGLEFSSSGSEIVELDLPEDVSLNWHVCELDSGREIVRENHRIWSIPRSKGVM